MARINPDGWRELESALKQSLDRMVSGAIEETRPHVHVDTGRLQKSLRAKPSVVEGKEIVSILIAGGIRLRGIYREQNTERDVDYAIFEEMRHPQIRTFYIPALVRRLNA